VYELLEANERRQAPTHLDPGSVNVAAVGVDDPKPGPVKSGEEVPAARSFFLTPTQFAPARFKSQAAPVTAGGAHATCRGTM
jgi:hypothetical protein